MSHTHSQGLECKNHLHGHMQQRLPTRYAREIVRQGKIVEKSLDKLLYFIALHQAVGDAHQRCHHDGW